MRSKRRLWRSLLDLIYPRLCGVCGERLGRYERAVCLPCGARLALYNPHLHVGHERLWSSPIFGQLYSVYAYRKAGSVQRLLWSFKYRGNHEFAGLVASNLLSLHPELSQSAYDWVIATPLSRKHYAKRGYNQAFVLAKELAQSLGVAVSERHLLRLGKHKSQTQLGKLDRLENMRGAFALNPRLAPTLRGKRVLLVDDVLTTGATLNAQIELLEQAGALSVDVATASVSILGL